MCKKVRFHFFKRAPDPCSLNLSLPRRSPATLFSEITRKRCGQRQRDLSLAARPRMLGLHEVRSKLEPPLVSHRDDRMHMSYVHRRQGNTEIRRRSGWRFSHRLSHFFGGRSQFVQCVPATRAPRP